MRNPRSKWLGLILLAFLVFLTLGVYFKVLHATFVYDDIIFVVNNKDIQSFTPFSKFFLSGDIFTRSKYVNESGGGRNWRPIASLAFASEYALFGNSSYGFHLVNILLHLLSVVLVYFFIRKLTGRSSIAIITTSLWAVHPTLTEAVSWVSNQSTSLFLIFFLLATLVLFRSREGSKKRLWLLASYIFFALSLLSKETALAGIFVMPLIYFGYLQKNQNFDLKKFFWQMLPFLAMGAVYFLSRRAIIGALADHAFRGGSFWHNLLLAPAIFSKYVSLAFWPKNLLLNYEHYPVPAGILDYRVILGLLLFSLAGALIWFGRKKPWFNISIGAGWFFFFLLPVMQIIPFQDIIGERFLYAPLIGLFLSLVLSLDYLLAFIKLRFNFNLRFLGVAAVIMVVPWFSFLTFNRNTDWLNSESLWMSVLKIDPQNSKALNNLAAYYINNSQGIKAIEMSKRLIESDPDHAYVNLGIAYALTGNYAEAESYFLSMLKKYPGYKSLLTNLAVLYERAGRYRDAYDILKELSARYDDDSIKQDMSSLENIMKYNGSISAQDLQENSNSYVEGVVNAPAIEGNVVNSGISGRILLASGEPFEAALDIFKDEDMSRPFISVMSDVRGNFQIPLRPAYYVIRPANPYKSFTPELTDYQVHIGSSQWVQIRIEYK